MLSRGGITHVWPFVAIALLGLSALAYALLVPFTLWQLVVIFLARPGSAGRWDAMLAIALTAHVSALALYGVWSQLFQR